MTNNSEDAAKQAMQDKDEYEYRELTEEECQQVVIESFADTPYLTPMKEGEGFDVELFKSLANPNLKPLKMPL